DLDDDGNRHRESQQNPPLAEPRCESDQQQEDGPEEDGVAEAGVETKAVVVRLLADHLRLVGALLVPKLVRRVEASVCRSSDLDDDSQPDERDPVAVDRSESLQGSTSRSRGARV